MKNCKETQENLLADFAARHCLRVRRDECGDLVIPGKLGHLYEHSSTELGLMIVSFGDPRPRLWNFIRDKCLATGMTLLQNGDAEGALSFDPNNWEQARLAIKLTKVRPKRRMSEERRQAQLRILEKARLARQASKNSIRKGGSEAFFASESLAKGGTMETMALSNLDHETPVSIVKRALRMEGAR